jgi:hypothetical protein
MACDVPTMVSVFLKDTKKPANALLIIVVLLTLENGLLCIINTVSGITISTTLPS